MVPPRLYPISIRLPSFLLHSDPLVLKTNIPIASLTQVLRRGMRLVDFQDYCYLTIINTSIEFYFAFVEMSHNAIIIFPVNLGSRKYTRSSHPSFRPLVFWTPTPGQIQPTVCTSNAQLLVLNSPKESKPKPMRNWTPTGKERMRSSMLISIVISSSNKRAGS